MILGKTYFNGTENEKLYLGNNLIYSGVNIDFVISVKTDNSGTSNNNQFTIPTVAGNLYNVTTSDGQILNGNTDDLTITFPSAGTYDVNISGDFQRILFNSQGDKDKLLDIKSWGSIAWTSMAHAFRACNSLGTISATDAPDLTSNFNGDASFMFQASQYFNGDIGHWDSSQITNLSNAFAYSSLNTNLSLWDINQVTNFGDFARNLTFSTTNYDAILIGWAGQIPLSYNGILIFGSSVYTLGGAAATARAALVSDVGGVSDGGGI